jgi:hypothetical protein
MGQILSILWEILSILSEICYLIGIFRNHCPPPPPPRQQQFWKVSPENFFDNAGTIRNWVGQISFRPPNFFFPVRPWTLIQTDWRGSMNQLPLSTRWTEIIKINFWNQGSVWDVIHGLFTTGNYRVLITSWINLLYFKMREVIFSK